MTDLAEIERAIESAISTPWSVTDYGVGPNRYQVSAGDAWVAKCCSRDDARLIANAPTWPAALVARVRELEATVEAADEMRAANDAHFHNCRYPSDCERCTTIRAYLRRRRP